MRRNSKVSSTGISILLFLLLIFYNTNNFENIIGFIVLIFMAISLYAFLSNYFEKKRYLESGINDIDNMTGEQFEIYLKHYFQKLGYKVELTSKTNDYGADLILKKDGETIVIQAKRYANTVGIRAVQEIIGAMSYYRACKGIVITNNYFSSNAINLATKSSIELWDRKTIINRFSNLHNKYN